MIVMSRNDAGLVSQDDVEQISVPSLDGSHMQKGICGL